MKELKLHSEVKRLGSSSDYTVGRVGTVVELDNEKQRARVLWIYNRNGMLLMRSKRTWVRYSDLEVLK